MERDANTEEEIYKAFIKGVQRNLHVVFTMNLYGRFKDFSEYEFANS